MKTFLIPLLLSTLGWFFLGAIPVTLLEDTDPTVQEKLVHKFGELVEKKKSNCQKVELIFVEDEEDTTMINVFMQCQEWGI